MSLLGNTGLYEEDTLSLLTIEEYEALHSDLKKKYRDLYGEVYIKKAWVLTGSINTIPGEV